MKKLFPWYISKIIKKHNTENGIQTFHIPQKKISNKNSCRIFPSTENRVEKKKANLISFIRVCSCIYNLPKKIPIFTYLF